MKTFAKCIIYIIVLAFLCGIVGVVYKYTNGFNEDFKTFYIEYNGEQILTTENKMEFKTWEIHKFGVKYTFDKDEAKPRDYSIKIIPNMTKDFDYTVDGERYLFSKIKDLTRAFEIDKGDNSFMLCLPNVFTLQTALKNYHDGKSVVIPNNAESENEYPFKMVVSSYNNSIVYNILFKVANKDGANGNTGGGNTDKPTTPTTPTTPDIPIDPTKESHAITYRIIGNEANLIKAEVLCNSTAVEGETVNFSVSLIGDYKSEVTDITVYSDGKIWTTITAGENDSAANFYKEYSFTMPDGEVEIVVTIKAIEVSDYHTLSYDTAGSGDKYSVNVNMAEVAQKGDYVMVSISLAMGLENELQITKVVLQKAATGEEISVLEQFNEFYDFTMPDCDIVILITLAPKNQGDGTETPTTPTTPTGKTYGITYSSSYNNGYDGATDFNDYITVSCTTTAVAGEKVTVTISVIESFAELYEISNVMISYPQMEFSYGYATAKGNGVFEFTMPDFDIQLYIYVADNDHI